MAENAPLLAMRGISKSFGPVRANDNIDLILHRGDILGLLGENGAGKTTLMNVLFGVYAPDSGAQSAVGTGSHEIVYRSPTKRPQAARKSGAGSAESAKLDARTVQQESEPSYLPSA